MTRASRPMRRRRPEREDMEMTKSFKAILLAGAMIVAPFPAIAPAQAAPDAEVVAAQAAAAAESGRAASRERECQDVLISVVAVSLEQKHNPKHHTQIT